MTPFDVIISDRDGSILQGLFEFRFQLVYTSLAEQLVRIKELWDLALKQKGKERDAQTSARQRLNAIIQARLPVFPAPATNEASMHLSAQCSACV